MMNTPGAEYTQQEYHPSFLKRSFGELYMVMHYKRTRLAPEGARDGKEDHHLFLSSTNLSRDKMKDVPSVVINGGVE